MMGSGIGFWYECTGLVLHLAQNSGKHLEESVRSCCFRAALVKELDPYQINASWPFGSGS